MSTFKKIQLWILIVLCLLITIYIFPSGSDFRLAPGFWILLLSSPIGFLYLRFYQYKPGRNQFKELFGIGPKKVVIWFLGIFILFLVGGIFLKKSLSTQRVSIEQTNFIELFQIYIEDNNEFNELMQKQIDYVPLSKDEEEEMRTFIYDFFSKHRIRLLSTNELFSGIMYDEEDGVVAYEFSMKNGVLDGTSKFYYDSGEIRSESIFRQGELISRKCWDTDGNLEEC